VLRESPDKHRNRRNLTVPLNDRGDDELSQVVSLFGKRNICWREGGSPSLCSG
jgi:hypothetical protein